MAETTDTTPPATPPATGASTSQANAGHSSAPTSPSATISPAAHGEAGTGEQGGEEHAAVEKEGHAPEVGHGASPSAKSGKFKFKIGSGITAALKEVFAALKSNDSPTRSGAFLFVVSLLGIVFTLGAGGVHLWHVHQETKAQQLAAAEDLETQKKKEEETRRKIPMQSLGTFTIELKTEGEKPANGVMNLAEAEIQIRCDEQETCDLVQDQLDKARNQVATIFTATDRDELLSKDGKRLLKKKIIDRLNAWIPKGKIEDLYFSRLVVN